jgi:hypothetical protein
LAVFEAFQTEDLFEKEAVRVGEIIAEGGDSQTIHGRIGRKRLRQDGQAVDLAVGEKRGRRIGLGGFFVELADAGRNGGGVAGEEEAAGSEPVAFQAEAGTEEANEGTAGENGTEEIGVAGIAPAVVREAEGGAETIGQEWGGVLALGDIALVEAGDEEDGGVVEVGFEPAGHFDDALSLGGEDIGLGGEFEENADGAGEIRGTAQGVFGADQREFVELLVETVEGLRNGLLFLLVGAGEEGVEKVFERTRPGGKGAGGGGKGLGEKFKFADGEFEGSF